MAKCKHINRQFKNADGLVSELACELEAGHEGNHQADYECYRPVDGSIAQAKRIADGEKVLVLGSRQMLKVIERGEWLDSADVLASDIKPDLVQLAKIKATKGNMLDAAQLERKVS